MGYPRLRDNIDVPLVAGTHRVPSPRRRPIWLAILTVIAALVLGLRRLRHPTAP